MVNIPKSAVAVLLLIVGTITGGYYYQDEYYTPDGTLITDNVTLIANVSYGDGWTHYNYTDGTQVHKLAPTNYLRWDGDWRPKSEMNFSSGDWPYLVEDLGTYYLIIRLDDSLTLSKNHRTYDFQPYKIGVRLTLTPIQLDGLSTYHNVGGTDYWYIVIPQSLKETSKHLNWDNKLPVISNEFNIILNKSNNVSGEWLSNYKYQNVGGEIRLYYNQVARDFGIASTEITFDFNSYIVNSSTSWANTSLINILENDDGYLILLSENETMVFQNNTEINIPDNNGWVSSNITISQTNNFDVGYVDVYVNITHPQVTDLDIKLKSPTGTEWTFPYKAGANLSESFTHLSEFDNETSAGTWQMMIRDTVHTDVGILNDWQLNLTHIRYQNNTNITIPDNNAGGITSNISISDNKTLNDINVYVNIRHIFIGDLVVKIISSNGTEHILHNKAGGGADDITQWYDSVSAFSGEFLEGEWQLFVSDTASGDVGTLHLWGLTTTEYYSSGNVTHWHDAGTGYQTASFIVNMTTPTNTNYTVWYADNGSSFTQIGGTYQGNQTPSISGTKYQNTDLRIVMNGNITATPEEIEVTFVTEASADTTDPTYSGAGTNTTVASASCSFYIQYDDDTALHTLGQYIFSTNNTGIWVNESAVNWTATPEWANVTKTLNSTVDTVVGYRWYANDTAGNQNDTPIYTLTVTADGVPDTKFQYWTGSVWTDTDVNTDALWFDCWWGDTACANAEQSAGQATLNITNNGTASGVVYMWLNTSPPSGIRIFVDDDSTYPTDSIELSTSSTEVNASLAVNESVLLWSWANFSYPADDYDFIVYAAVNST